MYVTEGTKLLIAIFFLKDSKFGLSTENVQEVVKVGHLTPIRDAPDSVLGVMNLRGRIVTIIDLAIKLDLGKSEIGNDSRIFIIDWKHEYIGLLVDRVAEVIELEKSSLKPLPENFGENKSIMFQGIIHFEKKISALLNLNVILDEKIL
ncbi:MAG: chemotaxis protein CheW [Candidatus Riflebacteria bacterium]|nr:chemotaxis protein CheW [Candidatus Riflebacteria bacterium]